MIEFSDFIKAMVRPIIIFISWFTLCFMWVNDIEIPDLLMIVGLAVVAEYFTERAVKRFKE